MGRTLLSVWLLLLVAGCGARKEYYVSQFDVARTGWDTMRVDVAFAWRTTIGGDHPVQPEALAVHVFDASYDTLYAGLGGVVPLPDRRLGDRERLLIEACGTLRGHRVCVQEVRAASPKRIHLAQEISYPESSEYERGSYEMDFTVERQRFGAAAWERIDAAADLQGYLLAWVENHTDGAVRVPFDRGRGSFDLSRLPNYDDFEYYLNSRLLDNREARVHFDVYAGLNGETVKLASVEQTVFLKTEAEREAEVRFYAEQAAEQVIDELSGFFGGRRAFAYVNDWSFHAGTRAYEVELSLRWRGSFFSDRRYELEGVLEVGEDGEPARFRLRSGNRPAVRRWEDRVRGEVLAFGRLERLPLEAEVPVLDDPADAPPPRVPSERRERSEWR